jgi:protocatechuate 3,4-dioxygenase beta subunit
MDGEVPGYSTPNVVTRRQALSGLGLSAASAMAAPSALAQTVSGALPRNVCLLTPQAEEGPFYFDPKLARADIAEGRAGGPLTLSLQMIDGNCAPLAAARVDVWHADALGFYSGYDGQGDDRKTSTRGQTFLRGTQFADDTGGVTFTTIYPGWYRGRTTHTHFKIFLDRKTVLMGQIYFPDALSEFIYTNVGPYKGRPAQRDTINASDNVLAASGFSHASFCSVKEETDRYLASLILGVDRNGAAMSEMRRGPPPGRPGGFRSPPARSKRAPGSLVPGAPTAD